jgi:outer membrane protein OmpA-like peptidoglycan-associated protein
MRIIKGLNAIAATTFVAASLSLVGCATAPPRSDQVERARAETQALGQDPLAQQAAADDLQAAQASLRQADEAIQLRKPQESIDHYGYLALRHAQAGEARVQAARAREELARAQEDRTRVLLASREQEAAKAKAQLAQTQQQLAELQAKQTDRGPVVTLGDVLFDTGKATLKPGADLSLDRLASYLRAHPQTKVRIEGNTDSTGTAEYNQALSERRAEAVANALVARGVSADGIRTLGRGEDYPVASNQTAAGRQQNRRVEIVFSDATGRFAQSDSEPLRR